MINRVKSRNITEHFGIHTELTKLCEEVGELLNECYIGLTKENTKNIEDECADVKNILSHIITYFNCDEENISNIADAKLDRTNDRINSGWYDKHR